MSNLEKYIEQFRGKFNPLFASQDYGFEAQDWLRSVLTEYGNEKIEEAIKVVEKQAQEYATIPTPGKDGFWAKANWNNGGQNAVNKILSALSSLKHNAHPKSK